MSSSADVCLSPRAQFEQSVRQLSSENIHRHRRNRSISLKYNPYELQHVSSLRVSPVRRSQDKTNGTARIRLEEGQNFGAEEQNVWSQSASTGNVSSPNTLKLVYHSHASPSPGRPSVYKKHLPPLRPRSAPHDDLEDRPKTRHGPVGLSAFEIFASTENESENEESSSPLRKAKFLEGTMTSRSGAIASTWQDSDCATSASEAEETESETTPKAARRRRSSSFDLREFQPSMLTPSTIKRTLFGKREGRKEKKNGQTPKTKEKEEEETGKPKKRLRKSMSKLQFLSDKMKIFGSSSQDLHQQADRNGDRALKDEQALLDERKRKAEAAYAKEFSSKKQKDNTGLAKLTNSSEDENVQEFSGNQKYDSSTVRCRGRPAPSRRVSTGSVFDEQSLSQPKNVSEHDIRKRPSRRELEQENRELRALLRQSQFAQKQTLTKKQDLGHTSETEALPPILPLKIRRNSVGTVRSQTHYQGNLAIDQDASEPPVPPLPPQHPDRQILGNVRNSRVRRTHESFAAATEKGNSKELMSKKAQPALLPDIPKLVPKIAEQEMTVARRTTPALATSVSAIPEEPEDEIDRGKRSLRSRRVASGKENSALVTSTNAVDAARKEEWQWPDDVF